eukprot:INCI4982.4.p1 GENE.INCI4982.4~~INCI4982.4.p1  ORF type:complete len:219 (-),score=47.78 INCI4982.4:565-1221(-)
MVLREVDGCEAFKAAAHKLEQAGLAVDAKNAGDPVLLLQQAACAKPKYDTVLKRLVAGLPQLTATIPYELKKVARIVEKSVLNTKDLGKSSGIFDVVRGMLVCDSMATIAEVLERFAVANQDNITLVRVKERFFRNPSPGGWRDVMICFFINDDPNRHVCEIQIAHGQLLMARKGLPGHAVYSRVRNASELLEVELKCTNIFFRPPSSALTPVSLRLR